MTRLIHLTDLHFGLHHSGLVAPLQHAVAANRPDVVVVSGDLTQRALSGQFEAAMRFLRGLGTPSMIIPGNHDLPVYNPFTRLFAPFAPYRAGAATDLAPALRIGPLRLFGANTAAPLKWRGGRVRQAEIDRICEALAGGGERTTNILVCHHPLVEPPGFQRGETRGAESALARLADAGIHVVLSGHLHHWTTGLGITDIAPCPIFHMQTGTALCAREGERDHGFAVMEFDGDGLVVTPWILDGAQQRFAPLPSRDFVRQDGGWLGLA